MNKFNQQTTPIPQPTQSTPYVDKQFLHTFLAGAFLPLTQATITAGMAGIGTLTLLYLFDAIDYLKPMLIVSAVVWVLTWLYLQRRWLNLTSLEKMTGIDINGDGQIGNSKKASEPLVIRLDEVGANGHYRSRTMSMDIKKEQLVELSRGLLDGIPFTEREWTGKGKPFSSGQGGSFRKVRSDWLKQGFLEVVSDKDNRQGFDLTDAGWAFCAKMAGIIPEAIDVEDETPDLTDEQMEAIKEEKAAYAEKYQS